MNRFTCATDPASNDFMLFVEKLQENIFSSTLIRFSQISYLNEFNNINKFGKYYTVDRLKSTTQFKKDNPHGTIIHFNYGK